MSSVKLMNFLRQNEEPARETYIESTKELIVTENGTGSYIRGNKN